MNTFIIRVMHGCVLCAGAFDASSDKKPIRDAGSCFHGLRGAIGRRAKEYTVEAGTEDEACLAAIMHYKMDVGYADTDPRITIRACPQ